MTYLPTLLTTADFGQALLLRRKCANVEPGEYLTIFHTLEQAVADLRARGENAFGLSAPQLGLTKRAFLMKPRQAGYWVCFINPWIARMKGTEKREESCFSIPGKFFVVERPTTVVARGSNQYGHRLDFTFTNLDARGFCHEMDHLDGRLIDQVGKELGDLS